MACQNLIREAVDLGIVIAFRFYGRYPETGRSYYKPPSSGNETDRENKERRISPRRPNLMDTLQLPNSSILWLGNYESAGLFSASGVTPLPSPGPQNVGAH